MPLKVKTSASGTGVWKSVEQFLLKTSNAGSGVWKNIKGAYIKTDAGWKIFFGTPGPLIEIETQVSIALSGGTNVSHNIMDDSSAVTITATKYHWSGADTYTYVWQKSPDNINWSNIGSPASTTNPASGSSSSITKTLSSSDFTSGSDMYFRFVFIAVNSTYSTTNSSTSSSALVSYYGTPTPSPGSPSISGSTVVGSTAYGNIGTWTNSPTAYDYRVYYTSGLTSYPLTYAGVKSVSNKFLSGFSAALVNSASHGYKVNDTVIVSGMDSLFNGSHKITAKTNNTIYLTLPTPTAWSASTAYSVGSLVSYLGDAYYASISMPAPSLFSIGSGYSVGDNAWDGFTRYRCIQSISAVSAWSSGSNYATGSIIHYNGTRWQAQQNSGPGYLIPGTSTPVGPQTPSSGNYLYWSEVNVSLSNASYWQNAYPYNASYWTLQSFSNAVTSGTTTAPNYYEGTVASSTSISVPITTFSYKENIDLRGATTSGTGAVLNFGVKAYNQSTFSPSEYLGTAFIYGVPIISIGSITPSSTSASVPFTSSYVASYLLNLYTQPSITNVTGGTSTVTYFAQNTFTSGQQAVISGINPSQYNGTRTIQSATSTSFIVSANITGTYVSGGTAKVTVSGYPLTVSSNTSPRSITGLSESTQYYLEMTPSNNGSTGTMQTATFTTLAQPTISNISLVNTKSPSSATSGSFSSASNNVGTLSWVNGANSSSAWLKSVTGAGTLATQSDPGSLNTSGTFTINSSGTANATVSAINKGKSVYVTWAQTKAASYMISYKIGTAPSDVILGDSSASNPEILVYGPVTGTASQITINSVTVYNLPGQQGPSTLLNSGAILTPTNAQTDTAFAGSVIYSSPPGPVTITYSSITSDGFTVSWSASNATSYNVDIFRTSTAVSYTGYPKSGTTLTSQVVTGIGYPNRYTTYVTAINAAGTSTSTLNVDTIAPPTYTVTYDEQGGSAVTDATGITSGSTVTLPSTTRAGYTFNGWFTTSTGGTALSSPYTVTGNVTLYAQWTANSYTISYQGNNATSGSTASGTYTTGGSAYTIASNGFNRTSYTFSSWNTATNGTGTTYNPGDSYSTSSNLTLYAQWTANVYTVTFNSNGGTGTMANQTGSTTAALNLNTFTRSGYTFSGWAVTSGGGVVYANGGNYSFLANITLYAVWTLIVPTPNVTQITALGLGNAAAPYIRFTFTSTDAASLSIMLYRSATSSTGPWTPLASPSVQSTSGTLVVDFNSRTGTTSNWYYVDVTPYSGSGATGTAGTTRTSRVKRGSDTTTTTVYP
jgi:uncharacterized repeat protein (TIGR02543 family)